MQDFKRQVAVSCCPQSFKQLSSPPLPPTQVPLSFGVIYVLYQRPPWIVLSTWAATTLFARLVGSFGNGFQRGGYCASYLSCYLCSCFKNGLSVWGCILSINRSLEFDIPWGLCAFSGDGYSRMLFSPPATVCAAWCSVLYKTLSIALIFQQSGELLVS